MNTVGKILKKARLAKKLTLEEIEEKTKIKKKQLLALEEERYQDLPPKTYIQGFIKSYAQVLDLKTSLLLAIFRRDYKQKSKFVFHSPYSNRFYWTPRLTIIFLVILALLFFLGYLLWQYRLLSKSPYSFYNR